MNILRNQALIDKGLYQRAFYHFGLQASWDKVAAGAPQFRFFKISRTEDAIRVEPAQSIQFLRATTSIGTLLDPAARAHLFELLRPKSFRPTQKKAILTHLHLDLLLALAALQRTPGATGSTATRRGLLDYLKLESFVENLEQRVTRITAPAGSRSNIHTFNKRSILVDLVDHSQSRHAEQLFGEHVKLLRANPLVRHVEIAEDFDASRLTAFLASLLAACELVRRRYPCAEEHRFSLKLRKIRHTLKEGMYLPATNTVVLDPRNTDSLWHELGHWAHTWFEPHIKKVEDCEAFAGQFKALVQSPG